METRKLFAFFAMAAVVVELAAAATHNVGAPNGGWDTTTDLQTWADSQTFIVGDSLVFQYGSTHDVTEVSKSDYDSCQATNFIRQDKSGNTVIQLSSAGVRYFICTTAGHCQQGMKLEVNTTEASSPSPSPPATPPSSSPTTPPPSSQVPTSPESSPAPEASNPTVPLPPSNTAEPPNSSAKRGGSPVHLAIGFCFSMMMMMMLAF